LALPADASKTRLRLERIDSSEFSSDGTVRIFASIIELEGQVVDDRPGAAFQLKLNGKVVGRPTKVQKFQGSGDPLDVVLIVESSAMYGPKPMKPATPGTPAPAPPPTKPQKGAKPPKGGKGKKAEAKTTFHPTIQTAGDAPIDEVKRAVQQLLEGMPNSWRVFVINYGEDVQPHKPFRAPGAINDTIEDLEPDGDAADLKLIEAVDAAIIELKKERTAREQKNDKPARRLIVLVSDGLNYNMDKNAFRTLGKTAAKEQVPIHTIAFSPQDDRGPLLNLGEISKLSNGTFRWARNADDLKNQIDTLADELTKQYVLSFKIEESSIDKKTFQLVAGDLTSNAIKFGVGAVTGTTSRGLGWWWLLIIAGGIGLIGLVLVVVSRNRVEYANFNQPKQPQQAAPPPQQQQQAAPQRARNAEVIGGSNAPAQPRATSRGSVTVISGALSGTRVGIAIGQAPILVGKGPATLQILDDPTVSTRHAQISGEQAGIVVTDLGSTNGTFVNNQRISRPTLLQDGDLVRFGNTQIKFRAE
jgi:hypothetical protein